MAKRITKGLSIILLSFIIICSAIGSAYSCIIPDSVSCMSDGTLPSYPLVTVSSIAPTKEGEPCVSYELFGLLPLKSVRVSSLGDKKLYLGGMPFGIKFMTDGVTIVGFCDVDCEGGARNPSGEAGLIEGDMIKSIDGREIKSAAELTLIVEESGGRTLEVVYRREGREYSAALTPAYSLSEGKYKTGVYVRDSGAGIGTVTFIDPESYSFAGLGHGICEASTGELVDIERGSVVDVTVSGVVKGQVGTPGEIKGYFSSGKLGSLLSNTDCGVFGVLAELPDARVAEEFTPATREELREGRAYIYCTLDTNKRERYEVEISSIDRSAKGNKCFTVRITDKALLEKTGGIIQGMSGSPIVQNGKLVGAVTHVLINDPATGYGIFIENMLNQMGELAG